MQHPPDNYEHPKATDMLQSLSWIFLMAVYAAGVFWALIVKKPGTVGTRAYLLDFSGGFFLILALSQNSWPHSQTLFQCSLIFLVVIFLWHIYCTMKNPIHVHAKCVGQSRFPGKGKQPEGWELFTGVFLGTVVAAVGLVPFGLFIFVSACANGTRDAMIQERDRLRSVQMGDAMWEQEYTMNNFEKWKRGRHG